MAAPSAYTFRDVVCLVNGVRITGFAEGDDVLRIERNVDLFNQLIGADGHAVPIQSADRSGVATFRLLQTSKSNAYLLGFLKVQEAGLLSPFPFTAKDLNGNDVVIAEAAYPVGPPALVYGAGHNAREWRLLMPSVDIFAAGA